MLQVLFVCTGNICRSPLAEGFLLDRSRRFLDGSVEVRSAGTWGRPGQPAMPETVEAGAARGLDLKAHAATALHPGVIEEADLVIGMSREHRDEVVAAVPAATSKTFTLKELAALLTALDPPEEEPSRETALDRIGRAHELRGGPDAPSLPDPDVPDPMGLGGDVYRSVAWEIEEAVDGMVRGLFGAPAGAGAAGER